MSRFLYFVFTVKVRYFGITFSGRSLLLLITSRTRNVCVAHQTVLQLVMNRRLKLMSHALTVAGRSYLLKLIERV